MNKPRVLREYTRTELEHLLVPGQCGLVVGDRKELIKWAIHQEVRERSLPDGVQEKAWQDPLDCLVRQQKEHDKDVSVAMEQHDQDVFDRREDFKLVLARAVKGKQIRIEALESHLKQQQKEIEDLKELIRIGPDIM